MLSIYELQIRLIPKVFARIMKSKRLIKAAAKCAFQSIGDVNQYELTQAQSRESDDDE